MWAIVSTAFGAVLLNLGLGITEIAVLALVLGLLVLSLLHADDLQLGQLSSVILRRGTGEKMFYFWSFLVGSILWGAVFSVSWHHFVSKPLPMPLLPKESPSPPSPHPKLDNAVSTPGTPSGIADEEAKSLPKPEPPTKTITAPNSAPPKVEFSDEGFREKDPDQFVFSLGGRGIHTTVSAASLKERDSEPFDLGGVIPVRFYLKNGKMQCDVTIWGGVGKAPITVTGNEFEVRTGWDRNFTSNALEVVNEHGEPVFQMIRKRPAHWVVNGYFPHPGGLILATDSGTTINPTMIQPDAIKPLFKYPSWKYLGEYAEDEKASVSATPLPPIPSIQFSDEGLVPTLDPAFRFARKIVIQTNVRLQPTALAIFCEDFAPEKIDVNWADSGYFIMLRHGPSAESNRVWLVEFREPAFSPEAPLVVTLMATQTFRVVKVLRASIREAPP